MPLASHPSQLPFFRLHASSVAGRRAQLLHWPLELLTVPSDSTEPLWWLKCGNSLGCLALQECRLAHVALAPLMCVTCLSQSHRWAAANKVTILATTATTRVERTWAQMMEGTCPPSPHMSTAVPMPPPLTSTPAGATEPVEARPPSTRPTAGRHKMREW